MPRPLGIEINQQADLQEEPHYYLENYQVTTLTLLHSRRPVFQTMAVHGGPRCLHLSLAWTTQAGVANTRG